MASAWRAPTDENRSLQGDLPSHALLAPARSTAGHAPDLLAGTTAPGPHEVKVILTQGDHAKVAIEMALSDDQQRAWVTLDGTASAWLHRLEGARDDLRLQLKDLGVALQAGDGSTSGGADLGSRQAYSGGAQDGRGWAWAQGHPQAEAPAIKPPHLNNRRDQIGAIHLRA